MSFAATDAAGEPVPVPPDAAAILFSTSGGIPPTGGVNLVNDGAANGPIAENLSVSPSSGLQDLNLDPLAAGIDVVVSGHSHCPEVKRLDGVLYINPGSAGPRRFSLPVAVGLLHLNAEGTDAQVIELTV